MVQPISSNSWPLVVAHRGGAALWAENSITAFRGAIGLGVDLVEFDVHPTRDGKIVVIHDPTLGRTTTGAGAVADHEWSELEKLRLKEGGHEPIPLFDEVIDLIEPTTLGLRMEIKIGRTRPPIRGSKPCWPSASRPPPCWIARWSPPLPGRP